MKTTLTHTEDNVFCFISYAPGAPWCCDTVLRTQWMKLGIGGLQVVQERKSCFHIQALSDKGRKEYEGAKVVRQKAKTA